MREDILSRLRALGAEERLAREAKRRRQLRELERELAEVQQRIPAWSRVFFFVESADERREKELRAQLAATRKDLERARKELRADLEAVAADRPAFGVALLVEDALESGEAFATEPPRLEERLERLAKHLVAAWTPGLDVEKELERLSSASACQEAAEAGASPSRELARRLLAGRYFAEQERAFELTAKRNRLVEDHEAAAANVSLLERLNPFRTSPSVERRNALAEELRRTRDELRRCRAEGRRLLEDCLRAHPPLAVERQALETLSVATSAARDKELALGAGGRALELEVDRSRVLVVASLARLERTFRDAFPGVPLPRELAPELGGLALPGPASHEPLVRSFLGELTRSDAPELLETALEHARARGAARRARARAERSISLASRLAFWSGSEEKDERAALRELEDWHAEQERLVRVRLLQRAREMGRVLAPFELRDVTLGALHDLQNVSTNPGESAVQLLPAVFGVDAALRSLGACRRVLEQGWDLSGDEADVLDAIAAAEPEDVPVAAHDRLVWKPLRDVELARLLSFRLERTGFHEIYRRVLEAEERERSVAAEKDEVAERLSIWDRLNVFSKSPDKLRDRELGRALARLGAELEASVERLRAHLDHALHVYPPAQLYYSLPAVERAIRAIHAECRPIWITVNHREWVPAPVDEARDPLRHTEQPSAQGPLVIEVSNPREPGRWIERPRQELRYICVLVGKEEAQHALGAWAARVVGSFGELPGYHELLETWAASVSEPLRASRAAS